VAMLSDERRRLERELAEARKALALAGPAKSGGEDGAKTIAGIKTVLRLVEGVGAKDLKSLADGAKSQIGSGVVAFVATADGKASIVVGVTDDLTARISAVDLVRVAAKPWAARGEAAGPTWPRPAAPTAAKAPTPWRPSKNTSAP
jgi:alanyl-tRNA synthetase